MENKQTQFKTSKIVVKVSKDKRYNMLNNALWSKMM